MAMGPERSKPLHNFSMPCLKWGNQRFLRCVKVTPQPSPSPSHNNNNQIDPFQNSKRKPNNNNIIIDNNNVNNIEEVREKLMIDLRVAAKKLKVSIFEEGVATNTNPRPWNLRTRRAACKAPRQREEQHRNLDLGSSPSPVKVGDGEAVVAVAKENPNRVEKRKNNERAKFSVSLSKEEVEQDFWALVGTRPPRRPKKRPRIMQRQLDTLFPGLWLTEVSADSYKVADVPE